MIANQSVRLVIAASMICVGACRDGGKDSLHRTDGATPDYAAPNGGRVIESQMPSPRRVAINGIDLTGVGYDKGDSTAPLVVVEFSDFGCPYCGEFAHETFPGIDKEFIQTGKVFFKYVPFVMGMFPNGQEAARAGECAGEQGKFWAMYDRLFSAPSEWKRERAPEELFKRYAAGAGLDAAGFARCYAPAQTNPRTSKANAVADRLGVRVTPSFVVNGRAVEGALPLADFRKLLNGGAK